MKKMVLCCMLAALSFSGKSQSESPSLTWGKPVTLSNRETGPVPIGLTESYLYALVTGIKSFSVQQYDRNTLTLLRSDTWHAEYEGRKLEFVQSFVFAGRLLFISYYSERDTRTYLLHEIEAKKATHVQPIASVKDSRKTRNYVMANRYFTARRFHVLRSDNGQRMAVLFLDEADETDETIYHVVLLNEKREEIRRGTVIPPKGVIDEVQLSDEGTLYLSGREVSASGKNSLPYLQVWSERKHEYKGNGIPAHAAEIRVKPLKDGSIFVYGLSDDEQTGLHTGWFTVKINPDEANAYARSGRFEEAQVAPERLYRGRKKGDAINYGSGVYGYRLHEPVEKENGELLLIAERHYRYEGLEAITSKNFNRTLIHDFSDHILILNFDTQGQISWEKELEKWQHTSGYLHAEYASFVTVAAGNEVYFIYNALEKTDTSPRMKNPRESNVAAIVRLNATGEVVTDTLFDTGETTPRAIVITNCFEPETGARTLFFFTNASMSRNRLIPGKITF